MCNAVLPSLSLIFKSILASINIPTILSWPYLDAKID